MQVNEDEVDDDTEATVALIDCWEGIDDDSLLDDAEDGSSLDEGELWM